MNKKIFTPKQFILLIIFILLLIGIWAPLAFLINEDLLPRFNLWASLVFGTGTIITAAIAIGISILSARKEEQLRKQKLSEDANKFIKDNNDEILYIPLCLVANAYDSHHMFSRKIYNEFNVLNRDLQKEVLRQLNYNYELISDNHWIDRGIDLVKKFIKDNDLGRDLLYDNAKYFHRSIDYPELPYDEKCEYAHVMPDYFHWNLKIFFLNDKVYQENVSFDTYLDSFLDEKEKNSILYNSHKEDKPIDLLAAIEDLRNCSEEKICYWMMQVVVSITLRIIRGINKGKEIDVQYLSRGDAQILTFEDRYLDVLSELYNLRLTIDNKNQHN